MRGERYLCVSIRMRLRMQKGIMLNWKGGDSNSFLRSMALLTPGSWLDFQYYMWFLSCQVGPNFN